MRKSKFPLLGSSAVLLGVLSVFNCAADDHLFGSTAVEGMMLHCPFDASAAAAGGKTAFKLTGKGSGNFTSGIRNGAFLAGKKNNSFSGVDYDAAKIFSPEQGTAMFWMKPEDWKVLDKTFNIFLSIGSPDNKYNFLFYRPGANMLQFLIQDVNGKRNNYVRYRLPVAFIKSWHHLAITWSPKEIALYVDGLCVEKKNRTIVWPKDKYPKTLRVGFRGWKVESGLTRIDDLKLFNRPLDTATIRQEYRSLYSSSQQEKSQLLTVGKKKAVVDGRINAGEYAAAGTGFCVKDGMPALQQSTYYLSHDGKYLYLGVRSPQKTAPRAASTGRDGKCWEDDSVELWLELPNKHWYQFIFNSRNAVYDSRFAGKIDIQWNCKGVKTASSLRNGSWELEAAIPLSELENFKEAKINIGRSFLTGIKEFTHLIHSKGGGYGDRANFIPFKLTDSSDFYAVTKLGDLAKGKVDIDAFSVRPVELLYKTRAMTHLREKVMPVKGRVRFSGAYEQDGSGVLTVDIPGIYTGVFRSRAQAPVRLDYIYTDTGSRTLQTVLRNESGARGALLLKLTERGVKKGKVFTRKIPVSGQEIVWTEPWNVSRVPAGDYTYSMEFIGDDGSKSAPFEQWYRIPGKTNPWDNNKVGLYPGEVPRPWVPLKVKGQMVVSLTQKYELGTSALPQKIGAIGHDLLSRPAEFVLNGKVLKFPALKLVKSAADRVVFAGKTRQGALTVSVEAAVEYDGMLWFDFDFEGKGARIDSLYAVFPLKKEFAEEVHGFDRGSYKSKYSSGSVPETGWRKNLYSKPAFWVGSETAGLSWYAEDLKGWRFSDPSRTLELLPGKKETLMRLNMIDRSVSLKGKRRIAFGMSATPVKYVDREAAASRYNHEWGWSDGSKYYNYLDSGKEFFDEAYMKGHQRRYLHKFKTEKLDHTRFFLYSGSNGASPYSPEWGWFGKEWAGGKVGNYIIEYNIKNLAARNKWVWTYSCLNSKSFREFYLWQMAAMLKDPRWNIKNLYYDLCGPRMCDNREHGCGYTDEDGRSWATQNIRGGRDFHKRIYQFINKTHPGTKQMYHVSGQPAVMAIHAFADGGNMGETWFENDFQAKGYSYIGIFSPAMFRTQCSGAKWGYQVFYVPQFYRANKQLGTGRDKLYRVADPIPEIKRAYRHFLGYILVHNVNSFFSLADVYLDNLNTLYWTARREFFGNNYDLTFIPYWQKKKSFSASVPERVMISAYTKNGKYMMVIMNDTEKLQDVSVDLAGLGKNFTLAPHPEKAVGVIKGGKLSVKVPARDFRVYFLVPEK